MPNKSTQPKKMTKKEALELVARVVEVYRGQASEHRLLAEALQILKE